MDRNMFCFQCEQTAGCSACTGNAGVCGKKADTANLQDQLTGALIGLAKDINGNEKLMTEATDKLVVEGLFSTLTNVNFNDATLSAFIEKIAAEPYPMILSILVDTFLSRISLTMLPAPNLHNTSCVLS